MSFWEDKKYPLIKEGLSFLSLSFYYYLYRPSLATSLPTCSGSPQNQMAFKKVQDHSLYNVYITLGFVRSDFCSNNAERVSYQAIR